MHALRATLLLAILALAFTPAVRGEMKRGALAQTLQPFVDARMLAGAYDHSQPDGEWTYWDLSGRKIMTRVFRNGQTVESMQYGGAKYPPPPTPAAGG